MNRTAAALVLVAIFVVSGAGAYLLFYGASCNPSHATETTTSQLKATTFGAVTEYALPRTGDWANAVTFGSDGSVWFGEQALPGVAQYDPASGSLTEYQWSCDTTSGSKGPVTSIWGVAQWNGKVWATDGDGNRLIGLDPSNGGLEYVNTTTAKFPYLLATAPDGSLWFTTLSGRSLLGRLSQDLTLRVYPVSGLGKEEPIQVIFVNGTFGYMVALNPLSTSGEGGLYSFDPQSSGGTIQATRVGGNFALYDPDSLSMVGDQIWVTQHYPSNVVDYDLKSRQWTVYPTSLVPYLYTTLPYFVLATADGVWFNEHYANKIAFLNPTAGTMTEYSEATSPIINGSFIQNDLTIALAPNGLWFTSTSADYLGFVKGGVSPPFSLSTKGSNALSVSPGGSGTVQLQLSGTWSSQLRVNVSDSENITSVPNRISIVPNETVFPAGSGQASFGVTITARQSLPPGRYTVDVTVTDGLVYQTAFIFLTVS